MTSKQKSTLLGINIGLLILIASWSHIVIEKICDYLQYQPLKEITYNMFSLTINGHYTIRNDALIITLYTLLLNAVVALGAFISNNIQKRKVNKTYTPTLLCTNIGLLILIASWSHIVIEKICDYLQYYQPLKEITYNMFSLTINGHYTIRNDALIFTLYTLLLNVVVALGAFIWNNIQKRKVNKDLGTYTSTEVSEGDSVK